MTLPVACARGSAPQYQVHGMTDPARVILPPCTTSKRTRFAFLTDTQADEEMIATAARRIAGFAPDFVLHGGAISATFTGGRELQAIVFVASSTASITGHSFAEAGFPKEAIAGAIIHNETVIIPPDDSVIHSGDHVIIISPLSATPSVESLFK